MDERLRTQVEKELRDLQVLRTVIEHGPIGIVNIAERTDLPQHKVRYSLRMLENDGFVDPTPQGAVAAEDIRERIQRVNEGADELVARLERIRDDEVEVPG